MDNYEFCAHFAAMLYPSPSATILDYGCGAGRTVDLLRRMGYDAYGCDVFYGGGSHRHDVRQELVEAGIIRDMPAETIPFPASTFDLVLSNQVFEHVPDLGRVLDEIARVLKPGGILLSLFPDLATWREGHSGIPFLHWLPKASLVRMGYAMLLRGFGLGSHKGRKSVLQWSRDFCDWLDAWTYYRSYNEIRAMFDRRFDDFRHHETFWLAARFRGWRLLQGLPAGVRSLIVRKWVGMVVTAQKPRYAGGSETFLVRP